MEYSNKDIMDKIIELGKTQARMESDIGHITKTIVNTPMNCENHNVRIENLEKNEKGKWKAITAIAIAFISSAFALIKSILPG